MGRQKKSKKEKKMTIGKILSTQPDGNVVFSLININHAFGLAMLGADKETADSLAKLIGYDDKPDECLTILKEKLADFAQLDSVQQSAGVFVNDKFKLKADYLNLASKELGSSADSIDVSNAEKAADKINDWVKLKTDNKIKDLIKPDVISELTLAILLSTTLFKGDWAEQFEKVTDIDTFHTSNGKVKAEFMRLKKKNHFSVSIQDKLTMVTIPYKDEMMMTIMMPELGGLAELEKSLVGNKIEELLQQCHHARGEVQLTMPLFSLKSELDLKDVFTKLGHGKVFDQSVRHNYSKMTDQDVFISDAVHQATIDVDEKGTVAAAATAVVMMLRCMPAPPKIITIDKPFLFTLHKKDNVLFAGRVNQF